VGNVRKSSVWIHVALGALKYTLVRFSSQDDSSRNEVKEEQVRRGR
jgi:hypothetical protein